MLPAPFHTLITALSALPGVGPRMAERMTLHLFKSNADVRRALCDAVRAMDTLRPCNRCGNISTDDQCTICTDTTRDTTRICVVEEPLNIIPIERTRQYTGRYHVLHGTITPGADPNDSVTAAINTLLHRIRSESITEVILATNPTTAGDATALHITAALRNDTVTVTRLARGLSTGSDIEYADDLTLRSAIANRERVPSSDND